MALSNVFEKLGKAIFEAPFGANRIAKDAPELAEIRLALIEAVKAKSHRASGKNVFPYNLLRIQLRGIPEAQAAIFRGQFFTTYLTEELQTALTRSNHRFPSDLELQVQTTPDLPLQDEPWLSVTADLREHEQPETAAPRGPAKLVVLIGSAGVPELVLEKTRTNIGRTAEIYRGTGPSRRNDLVFTEDNEINRTVSREHAHIIYSAKSGEYRLFNDREYKGDANCGIWIVRDGLSHPIHRGPRGTVLQAGDEIHLGSAVLRFEIAQAKPDAALDANSQIS
jgi:hypothetical protein